MRLASRLAVTMVLAGTLVFGGLVAGPAAHAAITASQITTPSNPSFFIADEDASSRSPARRRAAPRATWSTSTAISPTRA